MLGPGGPSRITFLRRSTKPSSSRLSVCSRLMLGLESEVELTQRLHRWQPGRAHGGLEPAVFAQHDLGTQQLLGGQEHLVDDRSVLGKKAAPDTQPLKVQLNVRRSTSPAGSKSHGVRRHLRPRLRLGWTNPCHGSRAPRRGAVQLPVAIGLTERAGQTRVRTVPTIKRVMAGATRR